MLFTYLFFLSFFYGYCFQSLTKKLPSNPFDLDIIMSSFRPIIHSVLTFVSSNSMQRETDRENQVFHAHVYRWPPFEWPLLKDYSLPNFLFTLLSLVAFTLALSILGSAASILQICLLSMIWLFWVNTRFYEKSCLIVER